MVVVFVVGTYELWKEFSAPARTKKQLAEIAISKNSKIYFGDIHAKDVALHRLQG
jgi:hypothetical protein